MRCSHVSPRDFLSWRLCSSEPDISISPSIPFPLAIKLGGLIKPPVNCHTTKENIIKSWILKYHP